MRLLLISHYYPPEVGAPQRRWAAFVRRWRSRGVEIKVVTAMPHYPAGRLLEGFTLGECLGRGRGQFGETVVRVPFLPTAGRGGPWKLMDHMVVAGCSIAPALSKERPDVVLTTIPGLPSLPVAYAAKIRWRVPVVIEMRDAWPDLLQHQGFGSKWATDVCMAMISRAQRHADAVVSISEQFTDVLAERGVSRRRLHHIPNGIDPGAVPFLPPPRGGDRLRVLYLGTHGLSQGLDTAVRAIACVGGRRVEARFVGDGTEKRNLMELARCLDAPITFEGLVRGAELWDAYRWAHTCLVPLQDWAPFRYTVPSKLYEIMSCGRHITAALTGEPAQIVETSGAGRVVPPGNVDALAGALEELYRDRTELAMGSASREWVEKHAAYDSLADQYLEILAQVTR